MKNYLFLAITMLAFTFYGNAQEFKWGAKGGVNISDLYVSESGSDYKTRTSFHVGLVGEYIISDRFSFQPELLYSSQGGKIYLTDDYATVKLDYINVPLMAKYYALPNFSLEIGPQVGFLVGDDWSYNGQDFDSLNPDYNTVDFGLNFGLGYEFNNGIFLNSRYNLGLTNVDEYAKNAVFQFSVGYFFK